MIRVVFGCLSIGLWACQPVGKSTTNGDDRTVSVGQAVTAENVTPVNDFRIVPGRRVGPIRYTTAETDLLQLLGSAVVTPGDTVYGAEGEAFIGTTLYKGTADQLQILYQDSIKRRHPDLVLVRPAATDADGPPVRLPDATRWATADGLRIGTTLTDLERRNGKPFRLWGFGWDYGGAVSDWRGGRLDVGGKAGLALTLGPAPNRTPAQEKALTSVGGDSEFSSANASMRVLNPVVQVIQVSLVP